MICPLPCPIGQYGAAGLLAAFASASTAASVFHPIGGCAARDARLRLREGGLDWPGRCRFRSTAGAPAWAACELGEGGRDGNRTGTAHRVGVQPPRLPR